MKSIHLLNKKQEMSEDKEISLVRLIKKHDVNAFNELCKIYYNPLYIFLWRKTRNAEISKDLVQELFLNVWKLKQNLEENKSLKAYLYKAANNLVINHHKYSALHNMLSIDDLTDDRAVSSMDSEAFKNYLDDILQGLPERQRIVFILNKFEGFKYAEIADILDISIKTVESRMGNILKVLRKKMKVINKHQLWV